jgi:hypothetical protein
MAARVSLILLLLLSVDAYGQYLRKPSAGFPTPFKPLGESGVFRETTSLTFDSWSICFEGGSYAAVFTNQKGAEVWLLFVHSGYWTDKAKADKVQPIAFYEQDQNTLYELVPKSDAEERVLRMLHDPASRAGLDAKKLNRLDKIEATVRSRKRIPELKDFEKKWRTDP